MVEGDAIERKFSMPERNSKPYKPPDKWDIYWPNVIALLILHLSAIYGLYLRPYTLPQSVFFAKIVSLISTIGITAGAHRLWCHRSYKATTLGQIILMFMASLTYQNSVYTWCRDHRMHHKYSETNADPHNANRGFFFSHVGWLMLRKHPHVKSKKNTIDLSDLEANPIVMFQHKYYYPIIFLCAVCITTFLPWYCWGESLTISFFRCTIYRYVCTVNLTWCVNSFAHLYGNKPYDRSIGPVECSTLHYFALGEGFHNYHHTFPWDYKASEFSNDTRNFTTYLIDFFAFIGLVYDRKCVSPEDVKRRVNRTGDNTYQNTKKTFLHKYLTKTVDLYLKNSLSLMLIIMFVYLT